jgi:hypothetical protein
VLAGLGVEPIGAGSRMVVLAGLKRPNAKMTDVPAGHRFGGAVLVRSTRQAPATGCPTTGQRGVEILDRVRLTVNERMCVAILAITVAP